MAALFEGQYTDCQQIQLVCGTPNTHPKGAFYEAFEPERARQLVRLSDFATPLSMAVGSTSRRMNSVRWPSNVDGRRFSDIETLRDEIAAWSTGINNAQRSVDWQMQVEDAKSKPAFVHSKIQL